MIQMDRHIEKMKNSLGSVTSSHYNLEAVYTYDELKNYYVRNIADLPYGLYVEPRRDRIVMNKQEFERVLNDACTEGLNELQKEIIKWIDNEVMSQIETETLYLLNSIQYKNGSFSATRSSKPDMAKKLGTIFGKALASNIMTVIDDSIGLKKKKRKK